jgi:hypothetical protein
MGLTENKPHKHLLEGLIGISITYRPSYLDKKRLIRGLTLGFIINSSKPNTPL